MNVSNVELETIRTGESPFHFDDFLEQVRQILTKYREGRVATDNTPQRVRDVTEYIIRIVKFGHVGGILPLLHIKPIFIDGDIY